MKKNLFLSGLLSLFTLTTFGQEVVVDSPEYQQRKQNGTLNEVTVVAQAPGTITVQPNLEVKKGSQVHDKTSACDCYIQPDATYTVAMAPNDDGSSSIIDIPFNFCFYGQNYNQLYINNNGNVTFENDLFTYSSNAFPSAGDKIIAPFWGDVDTRGVGQVVYKITPTAIYVNWENVGYYNSYTDKTNTFQLILTDGSDPAVADGNIAFCYKDMQWTTGDASGGENGFAGTPATAGANKGDNIGYFMVAQFDHPGTDFDGALGNADGISWLDNKSFYFNICNANNIPPIAEGVSSCDTFTLCATSDTANIQIKFLSPELDQSTSLTYTTTNGLVVTEVQNTPGNTASIILQAVAVPGQEGYHTVTVTATDDFVPAGVTTVTFTIFVDPNNGGDLDPQFPDPMEGCNFYEMAVLNGPYDSYLWDDLTVLPTDTAFATGTYGVTVSRDGCFKRIEGVVTLDDPIINLQGSFFHCPDQSFSTLYMPDSLTFSAVTWGLADPARDTMYINNLAAGTYTLSVTNMAGTCTEDTTFTVSTQTPVDLEDDFTVCDLLSYTFTTNVASSGNGTWSFVSANGTPTFNTGTMINPTVTFPNNGSFLLIYTDQNCPNVKDSVLVDVGNTPSFNFTNDFFHCPGNDETLTLSDSLNISVVVWDPSLQQFNNQYVVELPAGTYTTTIMSPAGCITDTTYTITSQPAIDVAAYPDVCGLQLTMANNTPVPFGSWTKVFGPGNATFGSATSINTDITVSLFGNYTFVYSENNCQDADTLNIAFMDVPSVTANGGLFCVGAPINLTAVTNSTPANLVWNDGTPGNSLTVTDAGVYTITATNGCGTDSDTAVVNVVICDLSFPNVFTPSEDNTNEVFKALVAADGFEIFECQIFNRWGNLVYEFDNVLEYWDGKADGKECSPGTYFYKVYGKTYTGQEVNYHGFVQLVRKP